MHKERPPTQHSTRDEYNRAAELGLFGPTELVNMLTKKFGMFALALFFLMGTLKCNSQVSPTIIHDAVYSFDEFNQPLLFSKNTVISTSDDIFLFLWDIKFRPATVHVRLKSIKSATTLEDKSPFSATLSSNGKSLATFGSNIRLWNTANWQLEHTFHHAGNIGTFSPNGKLLAVYKFDDSLTLWDIKTEQEVYSFKPPDRIAAMTFSQDGKILLVQNQSDKLASWDFKHKTFSTTSTTATPNYGYVAAFSPDHKWLVIGQVNKLYVYDSHGKLSTQFDQGTGINCLAFSADSSSLAVGNDGSARIYNVATWQLAYLVENAGAVLELAISKTGEMLVTGQNDKTVFLWHLQQKPNIVHSRLRLLPTKLLTRIHPHSLQPLLSAIKDLLPGTIPMDYPIIVPCAP